jgi:hypothetical protein
LPARKLRTFLDAIDGNFRGAAEHGEHCAVLLPTARPMDEVFGSDNGRRRSDNGRRLCAAEFRRLQVNDKLELRRQLGGQLGASQIERVRRLRIIQVDLGAAVAPRCSLTLC